MPAYRFEYELAKTKEGFNLAGRPSRWRFTRARTLAALRGGMRADGARRSRCRGAGSRSRFRDSNFSIDCDMVIPSIGQSRLFDFLSQFRGVQLGQGRVVSGSDPAQTGNPRYFAGGDCVNGGREVVDAVAAGNARAPSVSRNRLRGNDMADLTTTFRGHQVARIRSGWPRGRRLTAASR